MGLTCSLLGHEFGDPQTERSREESGDEVVITIRELQVCARCGAEKVTSENTEVRPVEPAPDSVTDGAEQPDEPEQSPTDTVDNDRPGTGGNPPEPEVEDDAVILDDDSSDSPEREPGEWPAADDTRETEESEQAGDAEEGTVQSDDDETDAGNDGGEILDADTSDSAGDETDIADAGPEPMTDAESSDDDQQTEASDWPDPGRGTDEGYDATSSDEQSEGHEYVEAPPDRSDTAFVSPSEETVSVEDADTVFVCPSCDFQEPVDGSSHRSGDICPACKDGYLTERSS